MSMILNWSNDQADLEITEQHIQLLNKLLELAATHEQITCGEVSLTFVDDPTIHAINQEYRNVDAQTDVLSFPMLNEDEWEELEPEDLLGDIIISIPTAIRQSEQYGHSIEREIGFLFIHGFLHLLGYDHETEEEEQEMFAIQERILSQAELMR